MFRIIFALFPGFDLLDFSGFLEVFHEARKGGLDCQLLFSGNTTALACEQGLQFSDLSAYLPPQANDWIYVPGYTLEMTTLPPALVNYLRSAWQQGTRIVSTCSGAFALGKAGILDGRKCTTHWKRLKQLQAAFPNAQVLPDRIFVEDGTLITSGGVTCGIDLALFLVEREKGPLFALRIARELNVYIRRDKNHPQTSVYLDYRSHCNPGIHTVQDWLTEHPEETLSLAELARIGNMGLRNFTRLFRAETGIPPGQYRTLLRLERAKVLLHDPHLTVEHVAARCGFSDARQLRRLWRQNFQRSPRLENQTGDKIQAQESVRD